MSEAIEKFQIALESLDRVEADRLFQQALDRQTPIQAVEQLVVPSLGAIGTAWEKGTIALSQVYMSGRFCEEMVDRVLPASDPDRKDQPRSAIVVLNDYHLLGKRIVHALMRASGFEVYDYGRMEVDELVSRVRSDRLKVLLISVLMLPSALRIREVREALGNEVKIVVGGAPFLFDKDLWQEVGADAMGRNASDAVEIVSTWMGEMQ